MDRKQKGEYGDRPRNAKRKWGENARKTGRIVLSLALAVTLGMPLASCRDTDVLTEKIIGEPYQYETDETLAPVAIDNPDASSSDRISEREADQSDRQDEWEENQPDYTDDQPTSQDETSAPQQSQTTTNDSPAAQGDNATDEDSQTSGNPSEDGEGGEPSAATDDDNEDNPTQGQTIVVNPSTPSSDPQPDDGTESDDGDESQGGSSTWNPSSPSGSGDQGGGTTGGTYTKDDISSGLLPPQTNSIAAAGPYATVVQALGGQGALAACNSSWYNSLSSEAFSNKQELQDTVVIDAWGDGTSMNEATFQAIVDSGAQAVITSSTYGGITQEWAQRFNEAGVSVVEMPALGVVNAKDADIVLTVQAIGAMLADAEGIALDASSMAGQWVSLHSETLSNVLRANGGYTTYQMYNQSSDVLFDGGFNGLFPGSSAGATHITNTSSNRTYTLVVDSVDASLGGVYRAIGRGERHMATTRYSVWPFVEWGGNLDGYLTLDASEGLGRIVVSSDYEVNQSGGSISQFSLSDYYFQHAGVIDTGIGARAGYNNEGFPEIFGNSLLWFTVGTDPDPVVVGEQNFPGVIARNDDDLVSFIERSAGSADRANLTVGTFNVGQDYYLYIMPDGIDGFSWLDGTFESFLSSPWSYCMFYQGGDTSSCSSYVNQFYETFYRCGDTVAAENGYGRQVEVVECNRQ